jgi:hypothetical protein
MTASRSATKCHTPSLLEESPTVEVLDLIEDVVSPEGIDHGQPSAEREGAWLSSSGRTNWRPKAENW